MLVLPLAVFKSSRARSSMPDSTSGLDVTQNLEGDHADVLQACRAVQPVLPA